MIVLSLFDGISCARVALDRLGYTDITYYASEVDKYAMHVSAKNWPDIIQLGDVRGITASMFDEPIDLLIGGSPCQDLSIAKAGRKGLDGERSGLFWEYVRIWKEVNPKYFVLENVNSMPKEAKRIISETFNVKPIMINAALVSAQNRKRLFWTNICADVFGNQTMPLPEDRGILLRDVLESGDGIVAKSYTLDSNYWRTPGAGNGGPGESQSNRRKMVAEKSFAIDANYHKGASLEYSLEKGKRQLVAEPTRIGDNESKSYAIPSTYYKENLKSIKQRKKKGLMVAGPIRIGDIGTNPQCETAVAGQSIMQNYTIRKLTPVECERLMTLEDGYTEGVSNTQRYKMLGNGFVCEVVKHILSFMGAE